MKSFAVTLFSLLCVCSYNCSADTASEDITRTLIVAKLLSQVEWQQSDFNAKSRVEFRICIFDDIPSYRAFSKNLENLSIFEKPIKVESISRREDAERCHMVYLGHTSKRNLAWFVRNNQRNKSILISEQRDLKDLGIHINLFLNKHGKFEFDLNPDAFIASSHYPRATILSLGKVIENEAASKANLLRSLVNWTEWPKSSINSAATFNVCSFDKNPFAQFAHYFLADKKLKGKPIKARVITNNLNIDGCDILLVAKLDEEKIPQLMQMRRKLGLLFIGNAFDMGEKGVHYNLQAPSDIRNRRFEINLQAFRQTGHVPDFQLLKSAVMVAIDYPNFAQLVINTVQLTDWPGSVNRQARALQLCVFRNDKGFAYLESLMPTLVKPGVDIKLKALLQEPSREQCDALLVGPMALPEVHKVLKLQSAETLLITSQEDTNLIPTHFNLRLNPKEILLELYLNNLFNSGFKAHKQLLESAVVIGGSAND